MELLVEISPTGIRTVRIRYDKSRPQQALALLDCAMPALRLLNERLHEEVPPRTAARDGGA